MSSQLQAAVPLKDRIAALHQKPSATSSSMHPSAAPARASSVSPIGQPTTPPKGTLRDKINKFERKGGVPVPRGSFGMGAPPVADAPATRSRELYGNRIPSVDKKLSSATSSTVDTAAATPPPSAFPRTAVDPQAERAPLSPDLTGESATAPSPPPTTRPRRRLSVVDMIDQYNGLDGASPPSATPTARVARRVSQSIEPASAAALTSAGVDPATANDVDPASALPTPPPSATAESAAKPGSKTDAPVTSNDAGTKSKSAAAAAATTDVSTKLAATDASAKPATADTSPKPTTAKPPPKPIHVSSTSVSEPSLTPVAATTKSYTVVVHRRTSTDQSTTTGEPRRSVSGSQDGHAASSTATGGTLPHIRSKRQFKHLASTTTAPEPPASPAATSELTDLLKDAAWFEATLGASFDIPSLTFDSAPSAPAPTTTNTTTVTTVTHPTQTSSTPSLSTLPPPVTPPQLRARSQASLASLSAGDDVPPTPPPKSARTRRFFSLRARPTATRTSVSSEMSSDDSIPVATPPSSDDPISGAMNVNMNMGAPTDALSMRSVRSGLSSATSGSSLRLSPHRGIARAATFAERMLGRAGKTRSMVDEMPTPIPEQSYQLPSPIPERSFDLSIISDASSPGAVSFDFDAFPSVPQDAPPRIDGSKR